MGWSEFPKSTFHHQEPIESEPELEELYNCQHCGTPTKGKVIGMIGKKVIKEMCQACKDYIGSPAAQQEGATMNNRFEMERKHKAKTALKGE
ncbi:MAG TPA: hypothetical protein VMV58_04750 [Desulfosporosinus sp.]|nr:hypothetical protein [Desulfosporosinus sp.]